MFHEGKGYQWEPGANRRIHLAGALAAGTARGAAGGLALITCPWCAPTVTLSKASGLVMPAALPAACLQADLPSPTLAWLAELWHETCWAASLCCAEVIHGPHRTYSMPMRSKVQTGSCTLALQGGPLDPGPGAAQRWRQQQQHCSPGAQQRRPGEPGPGAASQQRHRFSAH